jgi:histone H3/H4
VFPLFSVLRLGFQLKVGVLVFYKYDILVVCMEFSTRSMRNLIKGQTSKRVSKQASNQLGEVLEGFATQIAEEAIQQAKQEGYQTVQQKHIRHALHNNMNREHEQEYSLNT